MHKQHPQTAYRKYAILIGTIFENCDNRSLSHIIKLNNSPVFICPSMICFPPSQSRNKMHRFTVNCRIGLLNAVIFSAFIVSSRMTSLTDANRFLFLSLRKRFYDLHSSDIFFQDRVQLVRSHKQLAVMRLFRI